MNYFTLFPKTTLSVENVNVSMVDILTRVKLLDYIKNNNDNLIQYKYTIENELRPEQVSYALYESYDYTWIILILNNVYNVHTDWVLPQTTLEKVIINKYGSIENAYRTTVSWYDKHGYEVSERSENRVTRLSAYDKAMQDNFKKATIQVFTSVAVQKIQNDFKSLFA